MYINKLRYDDSIELFQDVGHEIIENPPTIDKQSQDLLRSDKFQLSEKFATKSETILSTSGFLQETM